MRRLFWALILGLGVVWGYGTAFGAWSGGGWAPCHHAAVTAAPAGE